MSNPTPMPGWTLARSPDDVPTPVAVAAADFCRRAGRPSSPEEVRLALARLEATADRRVLEIARVDPPARPLGPDALVDLALGMATLEVANREAQGYYIAMSRAPRGEPPAKAGLARAPGPAKSASAGSGLDDERAAILGAYERFRGDARAAAASLNMTQAALEARVRKLSLVRRVATVRRGVSAGPVPPTVRSGPPAKPERRALTPPAQLPKRGARRPPMGRMAQGRPERRKLAELQGAAGREELLQLLRSHPANLGAVVRRLNLAFVSSKGDLDEDQLRALIASHGLKAEVRRLEREQLRDLVVRNRGDLRAMAKGLHVARPALVTRLREFGLLEGAETLRGRLRREIQERSLEGRMRMLLKSASYLEELGVLGAVTRGMTRELMNRFPELSELDLGGKQERLTRGMRIAPEAAAALLQRLSLDREPGDDGPTGQDS